MRAAIVGGSVAGLATACRLVEHGWNVDVIERRPDLAEGGRAILLQPNGLEALERLGALEPVRARGSRIERVSFYLRDRTLAVLDYGELRHPHAYAIEIRPPDLRDALAERLIELGGGRPRLGCDVESLAVRGDVVTGVRYVDADGRADEVVADLVVGADGPGSTVRAALGIETHHLGAPESYVLGTTEVETDLEEVAIYCGRNYADGVIPLRDGTYFWDRVTDENRHAVTSGDVRGWRDVFEARVAHGAELGAGIGSWGQLTAVEVRPFWARTRAVGHAVLLGDAAGAVHPHSAQGANLALEDAVALGEALADWPVTGSIRQEVLSSYARSRQRRLRRFVLWSLLAARSYDAPGPLWRAARRVGFSWNRVGPVRRRLLARGAGVA